MRYNEILKEFESPNNQINDIKAKCSQIINVYKQTGKCFYRGASNKPDIYYSTIRTNRKPLNTENLVHNAINNFYSSYGYKTNRTNCIFGVRDPETALHYGPLYVIFPENGFHFLWSPDVYDLTDFLDDNDSVLDAVDTGSPERVNKAVMRALGKVTYYEDSALDQALGSGNEVMFSGVGYFAVKCDDDGQANDLIKQILS